MKKILPTTLFVVSFYAAFAQTKVDVKTSVPSATTTIQKAQIAKNVPKTLRLENYRSIENAFQIIHEDDYQPVVSKDMLRQIKAVQDSTQVKYLKWDEKTKIKILPIETVEMPNYIPVKIYNHEK